MNVTTLINLFRDAIHNNETLTDWCQTYYSRAQTVCKGVDRRNPPGEALYPLVHLFPVSKTAGDGEEAATHVLGITCGLHDDDRTETEGDDGTLWEYDGIDRLEAFRKLVETAAAAVIPDGAWLGRIEIEYETIEFFPFLLAAMELSIVEDRYQGDDTLG